MQIHSCRRADPSGSWRAPLSKYSTSRKICHDRRTQPSMVPSRCPAVNRSPPKSASPNQRRAHTNISPPSPGSYEPTTNPVQPSVVADVGQTSQDARAIGATTFNRSTASIQALPDLAVGEPFATAHLSDYHDTQTENHTTTGATNMPLVASAAHSGLENGVTHFRSRISEKGRSDVSSHWQPAASSQ